MKKLENMEDIEMGGVESKLLKITYKSWLNIINIFFDSL